MLRLERPTARYATGRWRMRRNEIEAGRLESLYGSEASEAPGGRRTPLPHPAQALASGWGTRRARFTLVMIARLGQVVSRVRAVPLAA
jgi:hypothetical protein